MLDQNKQAPLSLPTERELSFLFVDHINDDVSTLYKWEDVHITSTAFEAKCCRATVNMAAFLLVLLLTETSNLTSSSHRRIQKPCWPHLPTHPKLAGLHRFFKTLLNPLKISDKLPAGKSGLWFLSEALCCTSLTSRFTTQMHWKLLSRKREQHCERSAGYEGWLNYFVPVQVSWALNRKLADLVSDQGVFFSQEVDFFGFKTSLSSFL